MWGYQCAISTVISFASEAVHGCYNVLSLA